MTGFYGTAELLIALWRLGGEEDARIPTSHGILDRALKDNAEELPPELGKALSFGTTRVGLRCYELPDILLAAQVAEFTTEPNPTYLSSMVNMDRDAAREAAIAHGLSTAQAERIGGHLRSSVERLRRRATQAPVEAVAC